MSTQPPQSELKSRLTRFRELMDNRGITAALITNDQNVRYLSGFTGDSSALLITQKRKFMLTNFIYKEEAQNTARGWRQVLKPPQLMEKAVTLAKKLRVRKLSFEPGDLNISELRSLRKHAGRRMNIRPE